MSRGFFSSRGFVCLALAFMVFAWGTNYKLSLYKAQRESTPAKVCTRGSDAAKRAIHHAADGPALAQETVCLTGFFALQRRTVDHPIDRLRDEAMTDLSPLGRAPILYLRPPPDEL
jgi:hypothetical protein